MRLTDNLARRPAPQLYLQLGELVARSGDQDFAGQMFQLLEQLVPMQRLDLSEWTLDTRQQRIEHIRALGSAGACTPLPAPEALLQSVMQMHDPVLIQISAPLGRPQQPHSAHQCNLVSCRGERRWVICCQRRPCQRAFTLAELSLLKSLSDTLLPLVEHHALRAQALPANDPQLADNQAASLRAAFGERLARGAISLSSREQEVCLGLLTGGTVPQMAQQLNVKNSSVETYLKRATAKLGVSGRHGLARWMAGA
ncbi:helix-turn-helix transcriptional regulator [Pseudomonas fakonensis]|uniref:Helix-turn-helix transcriptional regulator n=1 Tax=Pseudomonas fakonensis TaxID=2842355 RepID=A0ABX8NCX4_9PSED|nr:helix-turn-helix transcriptional regulator [Pseudomonas fakonensis]QXH53927.1 helix-turn-helix transcriptional regulator [Pseudomonas fakonensis]